MGLSLPYSKNRRYLTGIDWIVNMFDHMLKQSSGAGNASQIMLELDGHLPADTLREAYTRFSAHLPVLAGRVSRDLTLAPYWKFPASWKGRAPDIHVVDHPSDYARASLLSELAERVNTPFPDDSRHVAFELAHWGSSRTFLAMRFDHRLFDARGAEAFLDLFNTYCTHGSDPALLEGISFTEPAHLSHWKRKFVAGQHANRALLTLAHTSHTLYDFSKIGRPTLRFRFIQFPGDDVEAITNTAYSQAGYLMVMPYLLARCAQAIHRVFQAKGIRVPDYVIPISLDMRPTGTLKERLFFNHVSFLFLSIRTADIEDRPRLIRSIISQMYDQTKTGLRENFMEASMLMRIAPLPLLSRIARLPLKGEFGSIAFSHVNETAYLSPDLLGSRVLNLIHTPRVPVPPGFGFFFNSFGGAMNSIFCYVPELLGEEHVNAVMADLRSLPTGG